MCAVSAAGDEWTRTWPNIWPPQTPKPWEQPTRVPLQDYISRKEFQELKDLVLKMKEELEKARAQDIAQGNPDCEMEEKVTILKKVAEALGVDLNEVFPNG